jgi:antitoxin VapB
MVYSGKLGGILVAQAQDNSAEAAMGLTIKNDETERLAEQVAQMAGESKTQAIRQALRERRDRLAFRVTPEARRRHLRRFLEREVWAAVPADQLGRAPDKAERERILGYGPQGV